jgi:hypothetical protein
MNAVVGPQGLAPEAINASRAGSGAAEASGACTGLSVAISALRESAAALECAAPAIAEGYRLGAILIEQATRPRARRNSTGAAKARAQDRAVAWMLAWADSHGGVAPGIVATRAAAAAAGIKPRDAVDRAYRAQFPLAPRLRRGRD